ncbi:hypothetical protein BsWGS_16290 [Bradybaena similaris]
MPEIDVAALNTADEGLSIVFIVCISVINILLITKLAFKKECIYSPRNLTMISLAIGDIFLAMFCLVIKTRVLFDRVYLGCGLMVTYLLYTYYLIHFVYGVGLTVLAVELMTRHRRRLVSRTPADFLKTVLCSAIPWVFGLVVILPLTLVGFDWQTCNDGQDRSLAKLCVSIIFPAAISVVACVTASFSRATPRAVVYQRTTQSKDGLLNTINTNTEFPVYGTTAKYGHPYQIHKNGVWNDSFANTSATFQHTTDEPPVFIPSADYDQEQPIVVVTAREKIVLVITSIIFFLCVVPSAAFNIHGHRGEFADQLSTFAFTVLYKGFNWLSIFRSMVTPLIWLGCYYNSRY